MPKRYQAMSSKKSHNVLVAEILTYAASYDLP